MVGKPIIPTVCQIIAVMLGLDLAVIHGPRVVKLYCKSTPREHLTGQFYQWTRDDNGYLKPNWYPIIRARAWVDFYAHRFVYGQKAKPNGFMSMDLGPKYPNPQIHGVFKPRPS